MSIKKALNPGYHCLTVANPTNNALNCIECAVIQEFVDPLRLLAVVVYITLIYGSSLPSPIHTCEMLFRRFLLELGIFRMMIELSLIELDLRLCLGRRKKCLFQTSNLM